MKKFTLRLNKNIYDDLKNNADYLGVTMSSVLKFNLYTLKDKKFDIVELDYSEYVRMTLSIPENFYDQIKEKSELLNVSVNSFINSAFYYFLKN